MADWLTRLGRVGGSTASGALAGTAFGPVGTVVGGSVGLLGGLLSDNAANEADKATEAANASAAAARERNRAYLDQLMGDIRHQQNPFDSPAALAGQYNQIARDYSGAGSNLNASLAARGLAGQAADSALHSNLDAARANAVTSAQSANTARSADWVHGQQQALMQLQGLSQSADQADMNAAMQMAQMRADQANQAAAGLNSTLGGLAAVGGKYGDFGKGVGAWQNMDWGGMGHNIQQTAGDAWGGLGNMANQAGGVLSSLQPANPMAGAPGRPSFESAGSSPFGGYQMPTYNPSFTQTQTKKKGIY